MEDKNLNVGNLIAHSDFFKEIKEYENPKIRHEKEKAKLDMEKKLENETR